MRFMKALLIILFFFAALAFFIQNSAALITPLELKMDFYFGYQWRATAVPFYFVVLGGFLAGALLTLGILLLDRLRLGSKARKAEKKAKALEAELKSFRDLPLQSQPLLEAAAVDAKKVDSEQPETKPE